MVSIRWWTTLAPAVAALAACSAGPSSAPPIRSTPGSLAEALGCSPDSLADARGYASTTERGAVEAYLAAQRAAGLEASARRWTEPVPRGRVDLGVSTYLIVTGDSGRGVITVRGDGRGGYLAFPERSC